ncbi:MAG: apolipoprotein N-acyltransferase [Sulfuricaulis sp.]|nr:apolipoprotein N-acyltransferase [Sulfuricaulis sp.]
MPPAWADAAALAAGLLLPLAYSPFNLFPLAVVSPALLFLLWAGASPGRAAFRGFLYGLGMFGLGVSWVYVSMHHYGNMPAPLAGLAVILFVAGLALYPSLLGWLQARFLPKHGSLHRIIVLPSLWVLFEWLRGWLLTGFPWLDLGYSQVAYPLAGYAPWLGVYGVSFFCAVCAGLLAWGAREPKHFFGRGLLPIAVIWAGGWLAGKIEWVQPAGDPLRVTLIQGNIPLASKWRPESRDAIIDRYFELSAQAPKSDLIVWPEAAVPAYLDQVDSGFLESLRRHSRAVGVDFLIGVVERDNDRGRYFNSVVSISPQPGIYRKRHLVPFGEFPPLEPLFSWLMRNLQIPMSDFSAGAPDQPPLFAAGQKIGVSICYEDAFGNEIIRALPHATLLVNVSEDSWFGDSFAPHQRLQMARMRAREAGRPMLRAANTGPSAVIDHRGELIARSPQFQIHALVASVQPMQGATPYVRCGNWPVVLTLALIVAGAGFAPHARRVWTVIRG